MWTEGLVLFLLKKTVTRKWEGKGEKRKRKASSYCLLPGGIQKGAADNIGKLSWCEWFLFLVFTQWKAGCLLLKSLGLIWSIKQANIHSFADQEISSPSSGALNSVFSDSHYFFSLDEQKTLMICQLFTLALCHGHTHLVLTMDLPHDGHLWLCESSMAHHQICLIMCHYSTGNLSIWKLQLLQLNICKD